METEMIKICRLKGSDNWATWKFQIRIMCVSKGIYSIVEGTTAKPVAPTNAQKQADRTLEGKYQKELAEWIKNDGVAQKYIVTSIKDSPMLHIINCSSSNEMWEKLHKVYENKSDTSIHMLQQKWFNYQKNSCDDIETHITQIQNLCCKLKTR